LSLVRKKGKHPGEERREKTTERRKIENQWGEPFPVTIFMGGRLFPGKKVAKRWSIPGRLLWSKRSSQISIFFARKLWGE